MFIRSVAACTLLLVTLAAGSNLLRIQQGPQGNNDQGFIEIKYEGSWTKVCSVGWDDTDATVACNEAGIPGPATAVRNAADTYGDRDVNVPFRFTRFRCSGSESALVDCNKSDDPSACQDGQEAGVMCNGAGTTGRVVLKGGSTNAEGNVEVRVNAQYGKICDVGWDDDDATVVCQELGLGDGKATRKNFFDASSDRPFVLDRVRCSGSEASIYDCTARENIQSDCTPENEAGVICEDAVHPVRLIQPRNTPDSEGNVEIQFGNSWKRVCDRGFGQQEADVICKQLGYTGTSTALVNAPYGVRSDLPFFNFNCEGTEDEFFDCLRRSDDSLCVDGDEAGVICSNAN